ncbi:hypothetical protein ZS55_002639 [Salmonella enterica subsp. salamae]|nr:hypothetical protein [Salmonella enterica subsp. salamae]
MVLQIGLIDKQRERGLKPYWQRYSAATSLRVCGLRSTSSVDEKGIASEPAIPS